MENYTFKQASAVWGSDMKGEYNQFAGFYTKLQLPEKTVIHMAIAARSYYRLYINGNMAANGPARCAKHFCRVDELSFTLEGEVSVAVEVAAYDSPARYCNDCTMEPGMLTAEITDDAGRVLAATGEEGWYCKELDYRHSLAERMSHCREIIEVYELDEHSFDWRMGCAEGMGIPVPVTEAVTYLKRRAPYADYTPIPMRPLSQISDWLLKGEAKVPFSQELAKQFNPRWYELLPEENCFLKTLMNETDQVFTGKISRQGNTTRVTCGENAAALLYQLPVSEVGFIELKLSVSESCILDVISSDHKDEDGKLRGNSYVARYCLQKGSYRLITFEPKLVRYVKLVLRTAGEVTVDTPVIRNDTYPDKMECTFDCNDGDVNRIYEASRRTLRLNTLDIFMDCPERERGGWLCDSQFTARGAWQLFGDLSVEKDFIENFMLTDPEVMWHGFFPQVYPGCAPEESDVGIQNWSFYLLTELYDYYQRSNDLAFIEECRERVKAIIEGMLKLRGESGILDGITVGFVDWSLSNKSFAQKPINIPISCLAVCAIEKMAELYQVPEWKKAADEMRAVIEEMDRTRGAFDGNGDGAVYENGKLHRTECLTESGVALELWSGFHKDQPEYIRKFLETMGYSPRLRSDPNIGKSNMFIGMMHRLEMLARLDQSEILLQEMKDLYLPELRDGAGTLFENYCELSGCHGFNGDAGALLTEHVLGLGHPLQKTRTIRIAPRPCGLRWASGSAKCEDGMFYLDWSADDLAHTLEMNLVLPEGWKAEFDFGFELKGWNITVNQEKLF